MFWFNFLFTFGSICHVASADDPLTIDVKDLLERTTSLTEAFCEVQLVANWTRYQQTYGTTKSDINDIFLFKVFSWLTDQRMLIILVMFVPFRFESRAILMKGY